MRWLLQDLAAAGGRNAIGAGKHAAGLAGRARGGAADIMSSVADAAERVRGSRLYPVSFGFDGAKGCGIESISKTSIATLAWLHADILADVTVGLQGQCLPHELCRAWPSNEVYACSRLARQPL